MDMPLEIHDLAKQFFGFGDTPGTIKIIIPSVEQTREVSLRCKNYPRFNYEVSPDDMHSAIRVHALLTSIYGERENIEIISHKELSSNPVDYNRIFIGGPPTNIFVFLVTHEAPIHFSQDNINRVIHGTKNDYEIGFSSTDPHSRSIAEDYCLISKRSYNQKVEFVIAGLRAYGQLASYYFLNDEHFYQAVKDVFHANGFQVLVKIKVEGVTCLGWEIVEKIALEPTEEEWDVFISYSYKDSAIIQEIVADLKKQGIRYWLDTEQLQPGDNISQKIEKGLKRSKSVMPCLSDNQLKSGWSRAEYTAILNKLIRGSSEQKVIPLILDDLKDQDIPPLLSDLQYVRRSDKREYERLLSFLK